jgi:HEAT repeat protein
MRILLLVTVPLFGVGCGKGKEQYSVPQLLEKLKDTNPDTRYWVARELGHHRAEAESVVPALAEALKDQDRRVRTGVAYALAEIGPEAKTAISALQQALKDSDSEVQKGAAYALQKIRAPSAKAKPAEKTTPPKHKRDPRKPEG